MTSSYEQARSYIPQAVKKAKRIGKVADDKTARTLSLYTAGAYGEPGEKEKDEYVLRLLLPNRLQDQFCFATERAIENLEFIRGERYGK